MVGRCPLVFCDVRIATFSVVRGLHRPGNWYNTEDSVVGQRATRQGIMRQPDGQTKKCLTIGAAGDVDPTRFWYPGAAPPQTDLAGEGIGEDADALQAKPERAPVRI